jgi:endonuclease I
MKKFVFLFILSPMLAFSQAVLPTSWNFSNPTIANPPTGWSYSLGTGNLTYASGVGDAISIRLDQQDEYLQINFADKPGPLSYYIKGTAISPPAFTGEFQVQESVDGTSWTTVHSFTSMTGTLTRYQESLLPTSRFVRFYYTTKVSGSNTQIDSVLIQSPPPPAVGFALKQAASTLVNGGTFVSGNAAKTMFTIQNFGVATDLVTDSIVLSGPNAGDFSIGAFDSTTTSGNGTDTFSVYFNAGAPGSRFATMRIYSNDAERNPFEVDLYAIGGGFASEPPSQAGAVNIDNVRTHTMNVSFARAGVAPEKYILLRKTGSSISEVPVDGQTYRRGDYIGGAQVAYIGADSTLIKPNYILANASYSFAAFSFNGPDGYENYNTTAAPSATATSLNGEAGNYYNAINPASPSFVTNLSALVTVHDTVFYSNYAPTLVNNFLTRDTSGGKKIVNCVYTGVAYVYDEPFLWWSGSNSGTLTREHTFAQSWMPSNTGGTWPEIGGKEVQEYNDLHNLFPTHQTNANAKRSNNPFGIVTNATYTSPTGYGKLGTDVGGKTVYEPKDSQKGDLARALFYMLVSYNGVRGNAWRLPASQDVNVLIQWHQQDPPGAEEIARHEYIANIQHNRNPFIDHPEWVNRINFNDMTYIIDPALELITVTAPNGSENWVAGQSKNITWTYQNVDTVVVEYRTATSGSWTLISDVTPAIAGSLAWSVPSVSTSQAAIKISKKGNLSITDMSNNPFTITVPSLTITAPVGGENLGEQTPDTITWTSVGVADSITIDLYVADTLNRFVGKAKASAGMFVWTPTSPRTTAAKIKLTATQPALTSTSPASFTISGETSLKEMLSSTAFVIYPNPSKGRVNIDLADANIHSANIVVMDITGRVLSEKQLSNKHASIELVQSGIYFLKLETAKGSIVKKIIIE